MYSIASDVPTWRFRRESINQQHPSRRQTVFVTLFNGRRVEGRVTAMLKTVAGIKYRVISGDLLFQVSREQIVDVARPVREVHVA